MEPVLTRDPLWGASSPRTALTRLDLPEPTGPMTTMSCPGLLARFMSESVSTSDSSKFRIIMLTIPEQEIRSKMSVSLS